MKRSSPNHINRQDDFYPHHRPANLAPSHFAVVVLKEIIDSEQITRSTS